MTGIASKALGDIILGAGAEFWSGKGGVLALLSLLSAGAYAIHDYYDRPLQDRIHKRKILFAAIPPFLIASAIGVAFCFWNATFRLLVDERLKREGLQAEVEWLKKPKLEPLKKSDFVFQLDASPISNGRHLLKIEVSNRSSVTISDYAIVLCIPGCTLFGIESMYRSPWIPHDDRSCRSLDSEGQSQVRRKWGLGFQSLEMACGSEVSKVRADITFGIGNTNPFNYQYTIPLKSAASSSK